MNQQIKKATYYIESHLDDDLDVFQVAHVAGYSHFHFCRIFKMHTGESVMSYVIRLRLEKASLQLNLGNNSMIEIAFDAGYQTPTGFLKAFKKQFGMTPTDYKNQSHLWFNHYKDIKMDKVEIVTREVAHVVFTRELGDYYKSADIAWERLSNAMNGLEAQFKQRPPSYEMVLGKENGEAIGICHDDPQVTNEENIRYDAALAWDKKDVETLAHYGFETKTISGGKYAKTSYMGTAKDSDKAWYGLYAWIEKKGHTFRDEPAFEKYVNGFEEPDDTKILTEVYVPIV